MSHTDGVKSNTIFQSVDCSFELYYFSQRRAAHVSTKWPPHILTIAKRLSEVLNLGMTRQPHVKNGNNPQSSLPVVLFEPFQTLRVSLPLSLAPSFSLCTPSSSPPSLPQQSHRGLLVVKSVFLQPGISTGQHSVRTLHSLCLPL